ncbi:MAG: EamA family transporter RarD [Alphaproteobacteria bacterium]
MRADPGAAPPTIGPGPSTAETAVDGATPAITEDKGPAAGLAFALGAFGLWGLSPAYWKLLAHVAPFEVLAHRVVWSVLLLGGFMVQGSRLPNLFRALKSWRVVLALVVTSALISVNWVTFIWAVSVGRVLETSLGYFMNPLISVALGFLVLGERLNRAQTIAILLACAGVINLTWALGVPPWISLMLAVSFGLYGLVRKVLPVGALEGLFAETVVVLPVAVGYLAWMAFAGGASFGTMGIWTNLFLIFSGPVTVVPLLLFGLAARRLRLSTLGLTQYSAPTIHFVLAVWAFGEAITGAHLVTFALIWSGLAVFTTDSLRRR